VDEIKIPHRLSYWPSQYKTFGIPPLSDLEPYLEAPARVTGHVSWNGVDPRHPEATFNERREAVLHWPWKNVLSEHGGKIPPRRHEYPVVRVLLYHQGLAPTRNLIIVNDCGIIACCNPGHWHVDSSYRDVCELSLTKMRQKLFFIK
jgi:hypothetical protein